jgi:Holliday junction resolvase RusA-like endonuclease
MNTSKSLKNNVVTPLSPQTCGVSLDHEIEGKEAIGEARKNSGDSSVSSSFINNLHLTTVTKSGVLSPTHLTITIPGPIKGKQRPRATRQGRVYTPAATVNAEAWVRACAVEQVGNPCLDGALTLRADITVPVASSWPKKRTEQALSGALRPTGKPDADNVLKLLSDALNGVVWRDDAQLVEVMVTKRYGEKPSTILTVGVVG